MPSVCFVCLGNICRSPMAHAIAAHLVAERGLPDWRIDSCGTGHWHVGEEADPRTLATLRSHGIGHRHRARQLARDDYHRFDWLLAMDERNLAHLREQAPAAASARLALFGDFDPDGAGAVPDPYYGGEDGFPRVYEQVWRTCVAFFDEQA